MPDIIFLSKMMKSQISLEKFFLLILINNIIILLINCNAIDNDDFGDY